MVYLALGVWFLVLIVLLAVGIAVLWVVLLVDSIKRKFKDSGEKIAWVLVNILLGVFGAIIYYFVVYREDKSKSIKWIWVTLLILLVLFILDVVLMILTSVPEV